MSKKNKKEQVEVKKKVNGKEKDQHIASVPEEKEQEKTSKKQKIAEATKQTKGKKYLLLI